MKDRITLIILVLILVIGMLCFSGDKPKTTDVESIAAGSK